MGQIFEEYGGMIVACLAGVCMVGLMLALGERDGLLYQFIVTYCGNAV